MKKGAAPTVFVYHEYDDSLAYGEQLIRVFQEREAGEAYLKERVELAFASDWTSIAARANSEDTVEPDYVSIGDGNGCQFFILEEQPVI